MAEAESDARDVARPAYRQSQILMAKVLNFGKFAYADFWGFVEQVKQLLNISGSATIAEINLRCNE